VIIDRFMAGRPFQTIVPMIKTRQPTTISMETAISTRKIPSFTLRRPSECRERE
jgi:hypothetical protein